jgi:hypothetical protein
VADLVHPLITVSPDARIDSIMRRLLAKHQHMPVVVDGHEHTLGLISLEDILDELVGEIEDESDTRGSRPPQAPPERERRSMETPRCGDPNRLQRQPPNPPFTHTGYRRRKGL